ncbi:MAG: type II secretion system F family protein, partial [Myxococcota bacterium]
RRINAALMRSGEWLGLRADEFLAGSLLSGAAGLLCALVATEGLFAYDVSFSGGMSFAAGPFAAGSFEGRSWVSELPALFVMSSAILFACAPWMYLRLRVKRRLSELELGLSEAVDLLKLCQDTGLSLPDALDHVIRRRVVRPQVQEELQRVRRALKNGQTPRQAFEALAERTPVPSALALASAFAHVEHRQRDLSQAFRLHAAAQRMSRQVEMEENAERAARVLVAPRLLLFGTVLALLLLPVVASGAVFVQ